MKNEIYREGTGRQQLVTGLSLFFSIPFILFGVMSPIVLAIGLLCLGFFIYFYKKWELKWQWGSDWGV